MRKMGKTQIYPNMQVWTAKPKQLGTTVCEEYFIEKSSDTGLRFRVQGVPFMIKSMKWFSNMESVCFDGYTYISMLYKADGLSREKPLQPILSVSGHGCSDVVEEITLIKMSNIITDGCWHRVIVKKSISLNICGIYIDISSVSTIGSIDIKILEFASSLEELCDCIEYEIPDDEKKDDFLKVDIKSHFNTSYNEIFSGLLDRSEITPLQKRVEDPVIIDGGKYFQKDSITLEGIPFEVKTVGINLISPPPESTINDEIVENFGMKVKRGLVSPVSRDDLTEIDINDCASELYFIIAADIPSTRQFKFVILDSLVEGQLFDEIREPFRANDIECFAVELLYEDGTKDMAFPYSLKEKRHIMQGMMGAYAVPASGNKLKKLVFHNRMRGYNFHIAAVTVNQGKRRLFPELVHEKRGKLNNKKTEYSVPKKSYIEYDCNCLNIGNSSIDMAIDITKGFSITRLTSCWLDNNNIGIVPSDSLYFTNSDKQVQNSGFKLLSVLPGSSDDKEKVELVYSTCINNAPVELKVELWVEEKPEINLRLTVLNKSDEIVNADIFFPAINNLFIGTPKDTWYMFPKYQNIVSSGVGTYCNQVSPTFPMQFFDIYNPKQDAGFFIMTKELNHTVRSYGLSKNEKGVTCFIQYPELHTNLKPGEPFVCSETVIGAHKGDWHAAAESYRSWLSTWYKPYKAQNKQWYKECFWLIAEITDTLETEVFRIPAWYDETKKHYKMRDIIEEHKRVAGRYPDILHFWCWCYSEMEETQIYGGYGESDYNKLGGLKNFQEALDDVQNNLNIPVSLYLNATLCNKSYPIADKLAEKGCMIKADGSQIITEGTNYRMCHSFEPWREYLIEAYQRVYRETGAKILYVDEFSLLEGNICFSQDHGHEVPLNLSKADNGFIRELRNALPEEVVLYGEFPPVDINSQYIDCNINYYNVDSVVEMVDRHCDTKAEDTGLSPVNINLYRFIFPGIVQLNLPLSIRTGSWHPLKFTFFNGEAIYDSFWDVEESRAHDFILKAYDIKKMYTDCFTSDSPETLVPTEMAEICANKFPGQGRILWTIYNRAFTTMRGELISVAHKENTVYYDVWNDKPINPRIDGEKAYISMEIGPQTIGCICQRYIG